MWRGTLQSWPRSSSQRTPRPTGPASSSLWALLTVSGGGHLVATACISHTLCALQRWRLLTSCCVPGWPAAHCCAPPPKPAPTASRALCAVLLLAVPCPNKFNKLAQHIRRGPACWRPVCAGEAFAAAWVRSVETMPTNPALPAANVRMHAGMLRMLQVGQMYELMNV